MKANEKKRVKRNVKQCEGYRRYGGAFSLGPIQWVRCKENATMLMTFKQEGKTRTLPACEICHTEAQATGMEILKTQPLKP